MFCKAPWNSLVVHMDGSLLPDPVYKNSDPKTDIDEYWKQTKELRESLLNNKFHNNCISCKTKEEKIGWSRRKFLNQSFEHVEFTDSMDIRMLEIDMSNNCNLQCRMCSGSYSTSWIYDELFLDKINWTDYRGLPRQYEDKGSVFSRNANNLDTVKKIIDRCPNIEFVAIKGGEPFLEPENINLLDEFIKKLNTDNITLEIHTNASKYNKKFIDRFSSFKKVNILVSLETVNDSLYRYIRGGRRSGIDDILCNIDKFLKIPNAYVSITTLWMAYNIFEPVKIYNLFKGIDTYFKNVVAFPKYLAYNVLPEKHLKKAHDLIIENIPNDKRAKKSGILKLADSFLNTKQDIDSYYDFLSFSVTLDTLRTTDGLLFQHCPWLISEEEYTTLRHYEPTSTLKNHNMIYSSKDDAGSLFQTPVNCKTKWNEILPHVPWILSTDYRILDMGCGLGQYANMLHDDYRYNITGIDISNVGIEYAKKQSNGAKFICENLYSFKPEQKFDSCYSFNLSLHGYKLTDYVLDYVLEMTKRILHNVLKPNGIYIFSNTEEIKENTFDDWKTFFNKIGTIIHAHEKQDKQKNILMVIKL